MKVAPEHVSNPVLDAMGKPHIDTYEAFVQQFKRVGKKLPSQRYLVNYFISAHPGSTLNDALTLALYLIKRGMHPEQVQDFIPLPLTLSGAMYHTETNPVTGKRIYVAKTFRERKMQRALIQYRNPSNRQLIRDALKILKAQQLETLFLKVATKRRQPPSGGNDGRRAGSSSPRSGKSAPRRINNAAKARQTGKRR